MKISFNILAESLVNCYYCTDTNIQKKNFNQMAVSLLLQDMDELTLASIKTRSWDTCPENHLKHFFH